MLANRIHKFILLLITGTHNYLKAEIQYICHCVIYKKRQLQLSHEFSKQNTFIGFILLYLLENLVIFLLYKEKAGVWNLQTGSIYADVTRLLQQFGGYQT